MRARAADVTLFARCGGAATFPDGAESSTHSRRGGARAGHACAMLAIGTVPQGPAPDPAAPPRMMGPPAPKTRALGVDASRIGALTVLGHGGGSVGAAAEWRVISDHHVTIAVLANVDPPLMQGPLIAGYRAMAATVGIDFTAALPLPPGMRVAPSKP